MKEQILHFIGYFHLYDLILFASFALIAMCFVFLSFISFRKKFISIPLFLLGFCMMIAIPFAMRYFMEERFYKIEQEVAYDRTYNYSDVYQYISTITNVGKRNIAGCVFSHQILYDTDSESGITKYKHMILNYVKPKKVYNKDIPMDLKVGQSVRISEVMEGYAHKGEKHVTKIECYGKARHGADSKVLHGFYKPQDQDEEEEQIDQAPSDAGKDDMQAYTKEMQELDAANAALKEQQQAAKKAQIAQIAQEAQQIAAQPQVMPQPAQPQEGNATNQSTTPEEAVVENLGQPQGIPPQIAPPTERQLPPNWREERDRFNPPLLRETPR